MVNEEIGEEMQMMSHFLTLNSNEIIDIPSPALPGSGSKGLLLSTALKIYDCSRQNSQPLLAPLHR